MNDIKHNLKVVQENIGKALQQKRNKKLVIIKIIYSINFI